MNGFWDIKFRENRDLYGTSENDFLRQSLDILPKGLTLSLGEGEGRNAIYLAKNGHSVDAIDLSEVAMLHLSENATRENVQINAMVLDLDQFDPPDETYDCIISIWCHLPKALRKQVHSHCIRALKPGGIMLVEGYTPDQLKYNTGGPPNEELMYSKVELSEDFSSMSEVSCQELTRSVDEGRHNGKSAVVQGIWKKD